ncbi:MAG TPA: hypothetical protein VE378_00910 [Nitrososphaeraceae archaeon]|nr:hypothetical protein [Nitrososphaeraceae archaeon]
MAIYLMDMGANIFKDKYTITLVSRSHYLAGGKYCRRCEYFTRKDCFVNAAECDYELILLIENTAVQKRLFSAAEARAG